LQEPGGQVLAVEAATFQTSIFSLGIGGTFLTNDRSTFIAGARSSVLYSLLGAVWSMSPGDPARGDPAQAYFRLAMDPSTLSSVCRMIARLSDTSCTCDLACIALDDAVRIGGDTLPTKSSEVTGTSVIPVPAEGEETAEWNGTGVNWIATPPPAGTVFPRWAPSTPVRKEGAVYATGTDFLFRVRMYGTAAFTLERLVAVVDDVQKVSS